jgi:hypothetical protein
VVVAASDAKLDSVKLLLSPLLALLACFSLVPWFFLEKNPMVYLFFESMDTVCPFSLCYVEKLLHCTGSQLLSLAFLPLPSLFLRVNA